ncbi:MAG: DoxX family protein [Chloroflexota bacterium]
MAKQATTTNTANTITAIFEANHEVTPYATYLDWSLLATRLLIVFIFLWHGAPKVFEMGMTMAMFERFGLPGILGPITGWIEVIAGLMVLVGYRYRWATAMLSIIIVGAIFTVQLPNGMTPGLERDLLILVATLMMLAYGPGKLALDSLKK